MPVCIAYGSIPQPGARCGPDHAHGRGRGRRLSCLVPVHLLLCVSEELLLLCMLVPFVKGMWHCWPISVVLFKCLLIIEPKYLLNLTEVYTEEAQHYAHSFVPADLDCV